jgi:hypothetical protein
MVPISKLQFAAQDAYPLDLLDIFEESAHWNSSDDYTFTGRFALDPESPDAPAIKQGIADRIRETLDPEQADRVLALLEEHGWDVSFYCDAW